MNSHDPDAPSISVRNLTKTYGQSLGILDVSFDLHPGEVLGFVGPNGAGKTTTLRLLLGLIHPTSGEAYILGRDALVGDWQLRDRIGYLPGVLGLYRHLTGRQYLEFLSKVRRRDCSSRVIDLSQRLRLDLDRRIEQLSKGNRQKLGVIQAFMHSPDVLILDEPTSGLDPLVQHAFEDLVDESTRRGASILLSSHVLSEVEQLAQRVAIIHEAQIVALEDLNSLRRRAGTQFHFTFGHDQSAEPFRKIMGVTKLSQQNRTISCTFVGTQHELLQMAVSCGVEQVRTESVSLEDVFNIAVGIPLHHDSRVDV